MTINHNDEHEIKSATAPERKRLGLMARRGERSLRIVRTEAGFFIGVHINTGNPWRIVPVAGPFKTRKRCELVAAKKFPQQPIPVRTFAAPELQSA